MTIETLPVSELTVSGINPRQTVSDDYIATLAASISEIGLIQPLAGFKTEKGVEIVAGGCRLRALKKLAESGDGFAEVEVQITDDEPTARLWSSAENEVRRALRPGATIASCRNLRARGDDVPTIARVMGMTTAAVYRALALADLPDSVIDALDEEQISWDHAKVLTLAQTPEQLEEGLELAKGGTAPWTLKSTLAGRVSSNDGRVQFVGEERLKEAGAVIIRDLFDDLFYVQGAVDLDALVDEKIEQWRKEAEAEGFGWTQVFKDTMGRYDAVSGFIEPGEKVDPQHKGLTGKILYFNYSRDVEEIEGLVRPKDADAAIEAGIIPESFRPAPSTGKTAGTGSDTPKPDLSAKLRDDLVQGRILSIMAVLKERPELAIDMLAFQLSDSCPRYSGFLSISAEENNNLPSTEDNGFTLPADILAPSPIPEHGKDLARSFAAYMQKDREKRLEDLAMAVARALTPAGGLPLLQKVEKEADVRSRDFWTPTAENFFGRVRADYLERLYKKLLGLREGDDRLDQFRKLKTLKNKAAFMETLFWDHSIDSQLRVTKEQREAINDWMPDLKK